MFEVGKRYKYPTHDTVYECVWANDKIVTLLNGAFPERSFITHQDNFLSYRECKPVIRGWVNVYEGVKNHFGNVYSSKAEAESFLLETRTLLATIEVVYDPNKGD